MVLKNELTKKRLQKQFAKLIVDTMRHEDISLLEAYAGLAGLMTSEEVIQLAKGEVNRLNGVTA